MSGGNKEGLLLQALSDAITEHDGVLENDTAVSNIVGTTLHHVPPGKEVLDGHVGYSMAVLANAHVGSDGDSDGSESRTNTRTNNRSMHTDGNSTSIHATPQAAWRIATFIFVAYFAEVVASQTPGTLLPYISKEIGFSSSDSV